VAGLIQSLHAERDRLKAEGNAIRTLATGAGSYTEEQRERQSAILADLARIDADIAMESQAEQTLREAPVLSVTDPVGATSASGFGSLGEQLQAVYHAAINPRSADKRLFEINAATGGSETIGHDGGFMVQTDFQSDLMRRAYGASVLVGRTDQRTIGANANGIKYNVVNETSRATGSRGGGVQAYWVAEGATLTASRPTLAQQRLDLGKLIGLYYATDELLQDATALESWITAEFTDEFAFMIDDAIVRGTGAGIPQGFLNADALVSVAKETGQAADTIVAENVDKMYSRLDARSVGNSIWLINQDCWPQIFSLEQAIGTGGVPLFRRSEGLAEAPYGTLHGRPILPIEQAATVGDQGDISLVDLSQYLTISKGGAQAAQSMHVAFTTDEMAFRWTLRMNGRSKWLSALTPYKGSATVSPFVALDARA